MAEGPFVGIDVSKDHLDTAIRPGGPAARSPYDQAGTAALVARLADLRPALIVVEATGSLEAPLVAALAAASLPVAVVNPRQVRDFARATGRLAKTDALDAAGLAHFGEALQPALRPLATPELQEFRELLDRRDQLLHMRAAENNRLAATRQKAVRQDLEAHVRWLDKRIGGVEAQLRHRIDANLRWKADEALLRSIPGLGEQTARLLIGQLPELGRLDRRQLASLVGLAPVNCDSGSQRGVRRIVGGRAAVRRGLYMAALASVRHNARLRASYARLRARGKLAKVAPIAVARKLPCIANAVLRTRAPWRQPAVAIS
jgi:transposase